MKFYETKISEPVTPYNDGLALSRRFEIEGTFGITVIGGTQRRS
jgi:hypothetical protein